MGSFPHRRPSFRGRGLNPGAVEWMGNPVKKAGGLYPGGCGAGDEVSSSSCWGGSCGCSAGFGPHSGGPPTSEKTAGVRTPLPPWQSSGLGLQRGQPHLWGAGRKQA